MWLIGVIASMFYLGTLLFSSPLGWLSDTIGRKPVMVSGAALYTVALLLFTTTTDPYWFAFFRLLEGVGAAAFGPAAQAFVADITTEQNRSKAYGFLTTAQFGGLIVGPAIAAPLYHFGGRRQGRLLRDLLLRSRPLVRHVPGAPGLHPRAGGAQGAPGAAAGAEESGSGRGRATALPGDLQPRHPGLRHHGVHDPLRDGRLRRGVEHLAQAPGCIAGLTSASPGWPSACRCCCRSRAACWPTAGAASGS